MCSSHSAAVAGNPTRQVLPKDLIPKHYKVSLEPDLKAFTYSGQVDIDLDVAKPTKSVSVNILDLTINSVKLGGKSPVDTKEDKDSQSVTWTFEDEISKPSTLTVTFDGTLNDQLAGFYRSVHKDENGETQVVATTQMEATDCRRAFPCFDEPALKATFDIVLIADKKYTALSNSDVKKTTDLDNGKVKTEFNTTPKMSTYLVAFVVGELRYVESDKFRVPVRVYATPGLEERCQFSADLAANTLAFFEKTFDVKYPLPKLDMIGIHDFSAGAMENWGLVTYRVVDLFYTEGKDSASTKTRVAEVVQHELAHQWFGNLVTMDWWDGLWLNEGFATWMSWYSCNHFFPDWKVWETYVSTSYQGCLDLDGLRSSHPVQVPVARADEISQIFDAISYLKGSCVIRMVSQYLGEDVFIKGISNYLKNHAYGNTTTDDLWNALSEVSGKDVKGQMDIWTRKIGYPILTVEEGGKVKVTQNRYLKTADVKADEDTTIYPVWLGVRNADGEVDHSKILNERSAELDLNQEFYKINADQNGIFRVKYPESRLAKLAEEGAKGSSGRLSVEDRIGLVCDLSALAGGYSKTSPLLGLIDNWKRSETEANVWSAMLSFIGKLQSTWTFEDPKVYDAIITFKEQVAVPKAKEVGWQFVKGEPIQQETLKADLFAASVSSGNKEFVDTALDMFSKGFDAINPNLRLSVFVAVSKYGTTEQWEQLLEHYTSGKFGVAGNDALQALGRTKNLELKRRVLGHLLDGTVRTQDVLYGLAGVSQDKEGIELAWKWTQSEWPRITEKFPASLGLLSRFVTTAGKFTTEQQLQSVEKFFSDKDLKGIDKQVEIAKDRIRSSIKWLSEDSKDVESWLRQQKYLS